MAATKCQSVAYTHAAEGQLPHQNQPAAAATASDTSQQPQHHQQLSCWPFLQPPNVQRLVHTRQHPSPVPGGLPREQPFQLPVDEESKAVILRLCSFSRPHMRAWHLSWLVLFVSFISTFSPAALLPVLQDSLDLTAADIAGSNIASVAGAIAFRMVVGTLVDYWGPRYSAALVLLATAPAVFGMAVVQHGIGLLILRLISGLSLCTFVVGQAWVSSMFSTRIVGTATALSAGWGNAGGGFALLIMPLLARGMEAVAPSGNEGWRWAFFVPGAMQVLVGIAVLLASDDQPKGSSAWAECTFLDNKSSSSSKNSASHKRGECPIKQWWQQGKTKQQQQQRQAQVSPAHEGDAPTPHARPDLRIQLSEANNGMAAASAGASAAAEAVAAAAAAGGAAAAAAAGAPGADHGSSGVAPSRTGRLVSRTLGGTSHLNQGAADPKGNIFAALLNYRTYVLATAYAMSFGVELAVNNILVKYLYEHFTTLDLATAGALAAVFMLTNVFTRVAGGLASDLAARAWGMRGRLWVLWVTLVLGGTFCLLLGASHDSLPATVVMLVIFSIFCQAACGAVFGVVPFVSKRAVGLVTGVVASGGNIGALVCQALFFGYVEFTPHQGLYWMGLLGLLLSSTVFLVYFPMWGGMWCRPKPGASEEGYYLAEFSQNERARGAHLSALAFAHESRVNRGTEMPTTGGGMAVGMAAGVNGNAGGRMRQFIASLKLQTARRG